MQNDSTLCWRVTVRGIVQGIGFRPFIHRLARELGLVGWARNTTAGVETVIQGEGTRLSRFLSRLHAEAPALANVTNVNIEENKRLTLTDFVILPSTPGERSTLLPPDLAACPLCLEEVFSVQNRRFRYPFTNCTACGPRFTIVRALPYDRPTTTMADFRLCPSCAAEYENPTDRRFHAEPVACPICGPHVWLNQTTKDSYTASPLGGIEAARPERTLSLSKGKSKDAGRAQPCFDSAPRAEFILSKVEGLSMSGGIAKCTPGDAIAHAASLLREGAVIALQGLGGFHLTCDATNAGAVQRLRRMKDRLRKPLAVMAATLDEARRYGEISTAEATLLTSVQAPIVLVHKQADSPLASTIAPGNAYLGVMLPYTPLHHLLLRDAGKPLVMTSGNRRDEPLCSTAEEAKAALDGLVDGFLFHDRPIHQRCDDSVVFVTDAGAQPVRRSRGYVPLPVSTPIVAPTPILAVGAELKNTFCLLREREAFLSQHIGDMGSLATRRHFVAALAHFQGLFKIHPTVIAHDLHPDYTTTRYAQATGLPLIGVQHHHAHIAACLADNGIAGPVIGVAFDGTGYGTDGAIWGGEFLVADLRDCRRVAHLEYLPLPGGEAAIRRPYRTALAYLTALSGSIPTLAFVNEIPRAERQVTLRMIERKINTPFTSSCGRLFDAVAAIIGLRTQVTYEAQAAIELETVSYTESHDGVSYPFTIDNEQVRLGPLLAAVVSDTQRRVPAGVIGQRFHHTLAEIVRTVCEQLREKEGLTTAALSGGCWQNRLLLSTTISRLRETGFSVYVHHQVPANDGGISLGQAVVAAARLSAYPKNQGYAVLSF